MLRRTMCIALLIFSQGIALLIFSQIVMAAPFSLQLVRDGKEVIVYMSGNLTYIESADVRNTISNEMSKEEISTIRIDLNNVTAIDDAGLGMFLILQIEADSQNKCICVQGAKGEIASTFKLSKLSDLLQGC